MTRLASASPRRSGPRRREVPDQVQVVERRLDDERAGQVGDRIAWPWVVTTDSGSAPVTAWPAAAAASR